MQSNIERATDFLRGIQPGQRVSLFDPLAVNHPGTWQAEWVLEGEQPTLPYNPICYVRDHFKIYMRVWLHTGFISNLCACELDMGRKRLAVWSMPDDARHSMSATSFENRETGQGWQSTECGVLIETTGGISPNKQGHSSYITPESRHRLTCPGCLMRHGELPEDVTGVVLYG
ncbi:hypothetical protein [Streptomyces sp. CBMA29]|uniref:hypothetical protein n=1 Tax=Streptomyces sp. CBMA29 TaxID=1896314 RepID=UPI0016620B5D|nr:hypothetical protein [Streptomyces sp. CBMA29]MBD0734002.1 hypothetical protein [Streptomyces sp. CBMA29]